MFPPLSDQSSDGKYTLVLDVVNPSTAVHIALLSSIFHQQKATEGENNESFATSKWRNGDMFPDASTCWQPMMGFTRKSIRESDAPPQALLSGFT